MTYTGTGYCSLAGIEDSAGEDGLLYVVYCGAAPSNTAVRFFRPPPSARLAIKTPIQGRFTHPAEEACFDLPIRNTGDRGSDTYDIDVASSWGVYLLAADGLTPLTDTDADGWADTGAVAQGSSTTVVACVSTPHEAVVGESNGAELLVASSLDTSVTKIATLQTAVPARFAQIFRDEADVAMSLYLVQPESQVVRKATPDGHRGYDMAVAETRAGFAYFWMIEGSNVSVRTQEIEFTLLDDMGNTVRALTKLTDLSAATMYTRDISPAVAVAPDGRIGVLWYRVAINGAGQSNENVYFAVLDSAGGVLYAPTNLTNNSQWGTNVDFGVPRYSSPRITATADNRFVLAWARSSLEPPAGECTAWCSLDDVYYAVRDSNGSAVKAPTRFTAGVAGISGYSRPALTALGGNQALLAYCGYSDLRYAVLDSMANTVKTPVSVPAIAWNPDAVELASGNIVLAWEDSYNYFISYVLLDATSRDVVAGPYSLSHPLAEGGDGNVSVAADKEGNAILTWTDYTNEIRHHLFYALVDDTGQVVTEPLVFYTGEGDSPYVDTSVEGYGNTSYAPGAQVSIEPPYQGRFTHAGEAATFKVPIRNSGYRGADTYDIQVASAWPVALYADDDVTPLTDTDGDGVRDTGAVAQNAGIAVIVSVSTPAGAAVGASNSVSVTVRSSLNTAVSKVAILQMAVPAAFAQVYRDGADLAMSLYLVQPGSQVLSKATPDGYNGAQVAIVERASGFAYFWSRYRIPGTWGVREIEYTLLDASGDTVRGVSQLVDHTLATMETFDFAPAIAVAPDGRIGVLWYRELVNGSAQHNYNIYFAILSSSGNMLYGPANLTNSTQWHAEGELGMEDFWQPRIVATGDSRFVLAWTRSSHETPAGECTVWCWLDDVYYAVRDTSGAVVKAPTRFTNGAVGGDFYNGPTLTALTGNQVLLAYRGTGGVSYAILSSAGSTVKAATQVGVGGYDLDAAQLSTGNIVLAWDTSGFIINFVVLNGSTKNVVAGPVALQHPAVDGGNAYASVAADTAGHAILTWMEYDYMVRDSLYYALVDGAGHVVTPPMIFRTSQAPIPSIDTSFEGYGNTSYRGGVRVYLPLVLKRH
jgi:hypothetical protein